MTKKDIRKLTTPHMRCLQDIVGVTLWHKRRNADVLRETKEHPIEHQLRQKRLQWFGHLQRMPDHRTQKQVLRCKPQGKRKTPGGTQLRWVDLLNRDLAEIPNWLELVQNRDTWRSCTHLPNPRQQPSVRPYAMSLMEKV